MEVTLENKPVVKLFDRYRNYILPVCVSILAILILKDYFIPRIQIILAVFATPFVFKIKQAGKFSYNYAFAAIAFLVLYCFFHISVFLFFSVGCLLFFSIECQSGKIGILPFLFLVSVSPALNYLVNVFTFSIRLELSKYASLMLNKVGLAVENKGAYFIMPDGHSFSVDIACIGLNMFNTGLCMALLLVGFSQQNTKKTVGFFSLAFIFIASILLLILTNLLRIVAIVLFRSEPGTISHDAIGIASLIVYTLIPLYFLISFLTRRYGKPTIESHSAHKAPFLRNSLIIAALCLSVIVTSSFVKNNLKNAVKDQKLSELILPGYTKQAKEDGVFEFRKETSLIYIKPANKAYESDHPPAMCWQGSGFQLDEITETAYGNFTILTATLKRDAVIQYTAWWYDNGTNKTISQLEWRFSKGEPYRILNITTTDKKELTRLCKFYLQKNLFQ